MPTSSQNKSKKNIKTDTNTTQKKRNSRTLKSNTPVKTVTKRRTGELTLSKASATAIVSQANHQKKVSNKSNKPSKKIPLRVRTFFGCSLLLFCISFYRAVIRPQLGVEIVNPPVEEKNYGTETNNTTNIDQNNNNSDSSGITPNKTIYNPVIDAIETFFNHLSNRDFDKAFELLIPALQASPEIRGHFTSFRMIPFLEGIEGGKLSPSNFKYISTSTYGRDRYSFDLSYTLLSNHETYNETWEFVVDTKGDSPKITSMVCTTNRCSYHPLFRPENFGMMR